MLQILDPTRSQFLDDLASLQNRMTKTQAELTSGIRISKPSDDPTAVGDVLQLQSDIGRVTQVTSQFERRQKRSGHRVGCSAGRRVPSGSGPIAGGPGRLDHAFAHPADGNGGAGRADSQHPDRRQPRHLRRAVPVQRRQLDAAGL